MQHAVLNDKCEFVNALLDYKVDPNIGSRERPLLIAAENGFHKILETFLDPKRNVRFDECNLAGENVLHLGIFPNICYRFYRNSRIKTNHKSILRV